jgi:hypothetical protein
MDSVRTITVYKDVKVSEVIKVPRLDAKGKPVLSKGVPVFDNKTVTKIVSTPTPTTVSAYGATVKIKLDGKEANDAGGTFSGVLGGLKVPFAYCIDLLHSISPGGTYTTNVTFNGAIADRGQINNAGKIAWLMTHKAATVGDDREVQSGFQAAIWKQVYGDRFELLGTNTAKVLTAYTGYINALGHNVTAVNKVAWMDPHSGTVNSKNPLGATSNQDLVAIVKVVPIPSAVWLFGSAMVGLVGLGKSKSQKTAVAM